MQKNGEPLDKKQYLLHFVNSKYVQSTKNLICNFEYF
jgi:hypothetical protein